MHRSFEYEPYLKRIEGLFPMPRIMAQLSAKLKSYDSTIEDIAELLLSDATLVANVVRMSNSSYFNFAEKSETLSEAINRIGLREILCLVGMSVADQVYQVELDRYRIPSEVFWESSNAAAILMEALSEAADHDNENAYLSGLMREIGMLVINLMLHEERIEGVWDNYLPLKDWETQICGYDHMKIGGELLLLWQFPAEVCDAVSGQWGPNSDGGFLQNGLNLTNRVLARTGCDFSIGIENWDPFAVEVESIGLSLDSFTDCVNSAVSRFQRLRASVL